VIPRSLALLVMWVALWGEVSAANVASGVIVVGLVHWLFADRARETHRLRPWNAVKTGAFVARSLVVSSARVVLAVVAPTSARTSTRVLTVQLQSGSRFIGAIVANFITLTPGTMTLELDDSLTLHVHVLGDVEPETFRREILDLERRVASAVTIVRKAGA
jgi:multicomponent Na+:H+ antiporter subunit E